MTRRAAGLRKHAGQIAFPGGAIDATDASPLSAALRETFEEVGVSSSTAHELRVIGALPKTFPSVSTDFIVTAFVGVMKPAPIVLSTSEVAQVLEVAVLCQR